MNKKSIIALAATAAAVIIIALAAALLLGGRGKEAELPAVSAAPTATPDPEELSRGAGLVVISEFMEKNRTILRDEDGDFSDWIELWNQSDETVDISGWNISDRENQLGWTLPEMSLEPGQRIVIFASGKDRQGDELHTDFSLSGDEGVWLRNEYGYLCSSSLCTDCDGDVSMALGADGGYEQSLYPTPGYENTAAGWDSFQQSLNCDSSLTINEAVVYNLNSAPVNKEYYDWVELKNSSGQTLLLSDYYISDDKDDYLQYRLPEVELGPGELIVLYCTAEALPEGYYATGFELSSENEQLYLGSTEGELLDCVSLKDIPYLGSFGRMAGEAGWFYFSSPSPGAENYGGQRRVASKPESLTADGVYNDIDGMYVELSASGTIRYTLDGSAPTAESQEYTGPIYIDSTTVIRAVNFEEGALPSRALSLN